MPATSPGNAPGGPRSLIGDADRDRMATLLREHYAAGLLGLDELGAAAAASPSGGSPPGSPWAAVALRVLVQVVGHGHRPRS